jgi:hypothetical protein
MLSLESYKFYFQHMIGAKITTLEISLNTQDFSSVSLPTQDTMMYHQICFTESLQVPG